ncbi:MAG TPA: carboxypeptidase M32 [Flavisolibacter sp.]|nr:carboxypeptidase M32 [Flavisolibacter sp.]
MTRAGASYEMFREKMRLIADVRHAAAVLQWDQETYLPAKGAAARGQQISSLSEISHRLFTEDSLGHLMEDLLQAELSPAEKRNVQLSYEDYLKNKKYSSEFVRTLSEQVNRAFHSWIEARKKNAFGLFEKELDALVQLKRQETDILGYEHHPYDALLNEFEKGCTTRLIDKTFAGLLPELQALSARIAAQPQVDDSFLRQHFPKQGQWEWSLFLIEKLGFDLEAGRQDISEHPFSTSFGSRDVRITTRIDENDFGNMTWSCIHEVGHALYEQGLPEEHYGLPLAEACSYSIHESQSRLWENNVGRSFGFWHHYYPYLQRHFPQQFNNVPLEWFYKGINKVQPSLIRTESDEITYHLHVYVRYELEKSLIGNTLSTRDIPAFWNEQYKKLIGVDVPDDKTGCLQDVHWSHGSFGYFPTYSLGSFYAAQFYAKAKEDIPGLEDHLRSGNSSGLLAWLRAKVHSRGRWLTSEELCAEITGKTLDTSAFINYLLDKYVSIYTL